MLWRSCQEDFKDGFLGFKKTTKKCLFLRISIRQILDVMCDIPKTFPWLLFKIIQFSRDSLSTLLRNSLLVHTQLHTHLANIHNVKYTHHRKWKGLIQEHTLHVRIREVRKNFAAHHSTFQTPTHPSVTVVIVVAYKWYTCEHSVCVCCVCGWMHMFFRNFYQTKNSQNIHEMCQNHMHFCNFLDFSHCCWCTNSFTDQIRGENFVRKCSFKKNLAKLDLAFFLGQT